MSNATISAHRRQFLGGGVLALATAMAAPGQALSQAAPAPAALSAEPPRDWIDPKTGHRIVRLSNEPGTQNLYFHQNGYTPQGDKLVLKSAGGIWLCDLKTFKLTLLVKGPDADLLFTTRHARDVLYSITAPKMADGSEGLATDRPKTIYAIDVDTKKTRKIAQIPAGAINSINADGTLLLGSVAYGAKPLQPRTEDDRKRFGQAEYAALGPDGKPLSFAKAKGVRMTERFETDVPAEIFTIDLKTGARTVIHKSVRWLGHAQFSPTDPTLVMFCHEGPWHRVDRIWTIRTDGTGLTKIHTRTMNFEIAGHEFFSADGQWIWYDLQTPRGQVFWIAGHEIATGRKLYRRVEQNEWSVHYNVARDGQLFAGDGGDEDMVAHAKDGKWLYAFRPETIRDAATQYYTQDLITVEKMASEKLVDMSAHDYRLEPNLTFTPDQKWIVFTSNMHGVNHVYAVEVAKA
ncbi:oligogalacturonide lyase [Caulobacter rhizosphaerae]|uniref:Oligogalacturonide lyase n=1 Tax=Caulobacter rhizosphaerae TaxID=2010972 RepID=A0ABU1MZK7_9CAUL|nr:oligogalacturonate lyase family protein [Caulobacter rhizosphaerae]MDR6531523.1 oligogalacturonide lyase [Caulobacter rhizosphaerae]